MTEILVDSFKDIGGKDFNEDHAVNEVITTAGGLRLQVGLICDGVSKAELGIRAARAAADVVLRAMKMSSMDSIPETMVDAIQQANHYVFNNIPGGTSTLSMMVIDLEDNKPYGRLFVASVGDSPIYLMRQDDASKEWQIRRLNTEHNRAQDLIYQGVPRSQAIKQEGAMALTRAIGAQSHVEVDIGFYLDNVDPKTAASRGEYGMKLKKGDTVFACSDGLVEVVNGESLVTPDEFALFARDNDAKHFTHEIISIGKSKGPRDNISITAMLIPGDRTTVSTRFGMSARQRGMLTTVAVLTVLIVGGLMMTLSNTTADEQIERETRVALQATTDHNATLVAIPTNSPTPTFTPTSTSTPIPTSTPTLRPTVSVDNQVGYSRGLNAAEAGYAEGNSLLTSSQPTYLTINGGDTLTQAGSYIVEPAELFMLPNTELNIERVSNTRLEISISMIQGNFFLVTGEYSGGSVEVELEDNRNISFQLKGSDDVCASFDMPDPDTITFGCYSGTGTGTCSYEIGGEQGILEAERFLRISIKDEQPRTAPEIITIDRAFNYYQLIKEQFQLGQPDCLNSILDRDKDGFLDMPGVDLCLNEEGTINGCRDTDGDEVTDRDEDPRCISTYGLSQYNGCPDADGDRVPEPDDVCPNLRGNTASGCLRDDDTDNDGVDDADDTCPLVAAPGRGDGCPASTPAPPANPGSNQ